MYDKLIGALISTIGILGLTIFFIAVIIITKQCLKFIYSSKICPDNNKEISIGVFAMLITFTVFAFTSNTVSDITNISQFFVYISLALTCIKCSRNDYIDQFAIRDYPEISGCT
jgi:O-antigen ligase